MMPRFPLLLLLAIVALETTCQLVPTSHEDALEVTLRQGTIRGTMHDLGGDRYYYAFRSIPYAQPPLAVLRFRDPVPAGNWSQIRDGSVMPPRCPQPDLVLQAQGITKILGQEDCLYLNVYTPKPLGTGLPVMVYIHGGAFLLGSARDISPAPILTKDVVVVTFHYRLGTLGFLSTEDATMPGNLGLKDQTLALRWVKDNIRALGGAPDRITLFGTSAGAVGAHLQVFSPYAEGLFNQVILQSGTALCPWALRKGHRQVADAVGDALNCFKSGTHLDSVVLLQCLQSATLESLVTVPLNFVEWSNEPFVMIPRVDGDFLPEDPASLLHKGKVPRVNLITGINAQDGAITTNSIYSREILKKTLVENFTAVGPLVMNFRDGDEDPEYLARRVFHRYLGGVAVNNDNVEAVTKLFTDRLFAVCCDRTALSHSKLSSGEHQVYMYELHHSGQYKHFPTFNASLTENWVTHGDDLQYLFDSQSGRRPLQRPEDLMMRRIMVKLWTNFAATGNPTPDQSLGFRWTPIGMNCRDHLQLRPDADMHRDERMEVRLFWENLPTVQNKILFPGVFESQSSPSCLASPTMG